MNVAKEGQHMESLESLRERIEALEQHARRTEKQLRWWRGLTCGAVVLSLYSLPLVPGTAQEGGEAQSRMAHRIATIEDKIRHITRVTTAEGLNEVVISGANLRIVNGLGSTDCTDELDEPIPGCPNGLGNLIVGYNEPRGFSPDDPDPNVRTGSHNVVVGSEHNFSRFGGLVAGRFNEISGERAAVSGGGSNTADGFTASVSGGAFNTADGAAAAVSGGFNREAPGDHDWAAGPLFADF
jgi:hypothetical protein